MRKVILASVAMIIMSIVTPMANGRDVYRRIDYINEKGERFWSRYETGSTGLGLFNVGLAQKGFKVACSQTFDDNSTVKSIRFVPSGVESYPLKMVNEKPSEIELSYELLPDESAKSQKRVVVQTAGETDVLSNKTIRIWMRVPSGSYPAFSVAYEYTGVRRGEQFWHQAVALQSYQQLLGAVSSRSDMSMTNTAWRQQYVSCFDPDYEYYYGYFLRSADNPDLWYCDMVMPNEPMTIKARYQRLGSAELQKVNDEVVHGLYWQWQSISVYPNNNGEGYLMSAIGDYISQDMVSGLASSSNRASHFLDIGMYNNANWVYTAAPWSYCFALITRANMLLSQLDTFTEASQTERDQVKAQMLALRSHAYFRLLQLYGTRWSESNDGSRLCAPLEIEFKAENVPLASMKQIADRCYADLDKAIEIFRSTDFVRKDIIYPDINVARGIKMRLALLREDWQTAKSLSDAILAEKPLTSNADMKNGFFSPADSWIWGAWNDNIYYWSTQSWNACNGTYPAGWGFGCNAIDKDLYLSIPEGDMRRSLFVMPDQLGSMAIFSEWKNWYIYISTLEGLGILRAARNGGDVEGAVALFQDKFSSSKPAGVQFGAFTQVGAYGYVPVVFGAQVKFYQPGTSQSDRAAMLMMRADEVLLAGAEAAFHLGQESTARDLLNRLNSMRCPGYSFTATGSALLAEIQKTRKIELWGEGHSWFDQKRWNIPITRKKWVRHDTNSGNWGAHTTESIATDLGNGWRFPIPAYYLKYNDLVDISKMGYVGVSGYEDPKEVKEKASDKVSGAHKKVVKQMEPIQDKPAKLFVMP